MKYLFTILFLLIVNITSAQIVNIPDQDFKFKLLAYSPTIDTNGDGEIEVSEALQVTSLHFGLGISMFHDMTGIRSFQNLVTLNCEDQQLLSNMDLSNMPNLKDVYAPWAMWNGCNVNVSGCTNLETLYMEGSIINNLTLGILPKLRYLFAGRVTLASLDLRTSDSLTTLRLDGMTIGKLNISGLTKLQRLGDDYVRVDTLIASNCPSLKEIWLNAPSIDYSGFKSIDVTNCLILDTFHLNGTAVHKLDFNTCTSLKHLELLNAIELTELDIKNGSALNLFTVSDILPATPFNICADEFEIPAVLQQLNLLQRPININPYCNFSTGGIYNTITGKTRVDLNMNGCDINDQGKPSVPVRITDGNGNSVIRYTTISGEYNYYPYAGNFTVSPYFPYQYFTTSPASTNISFPIANTIVDTADFCISPTGIHNDLEISFLPLWSPARPGFTASYRLLYKNRGTTTISGNVELNYANNKMTFITASIIPGSQNTGQLSWNYQNLQPFESKTIDVYFNILPPPLNNINDTLTFLAVVNPTAGDETPYDNSFVLPQRVVGSYDPNDKQCLEGSKIAFANIDKYLHYIIHFQNLGNDTAFNIVVADTLSDKLDWNSVELISSSHVCDVRQKNGKLEFFFRDIKLPYKAINDAGSNGFVAFKVKPKNTVSLGDSLNNRAGIYFDFNPPVMTNMATTVVSLIPTIPVKLEYFSGSKKDEANVLTWKAPSTNGSTNFSIERSNDGIHFTGIGNINATLERSQLPFNFTDNIPLFGKNYYRLKITDADRITFYSKIILLENNKSGFDILSVFSDKQHSLVYFNAAKQQMVQLKIIAADGRLLYDNNKNISVGYCNIDLPLKNIGTGIYTLIIYTNDGEVITKRFIK